MLALLPSAPLLVILSLSLLYLVHSFTPRPPLPVRTNHKSTPVSPESTAERPVIPDTRTASKSTHFIYLAHGFCGSPADLTYLKAALNARSTPTTNLIVHCLSSNFHNTFDGIKAGGTRISLEIKVHLSTHLPAPNPTITLLGNSLGGLYVRYAAMLLFSTEFVVEGVTVRPDALVCTASPFLGISRHVYIPVPRLVERGIAKVLGQTGADLFLTNELVREMATTNAFLGAAGKFKRRIALSNAFGTDFLVPGQTGLFLSEDSDVVHTAVEHDAGEGGEGKGGGMVVKVYETARVAAPTVHGSPSVCLDSLGWRKVVVDVRNTLPSVRKLGQKGGGTGVLPQQTSSRALWRLIAPAGDRTVLPNGHNMIVANMKNKLYERLFEGGRPVMDYLSRVVIDNAY